MVAYHPAVDDLYRRYASLLCEHHRLLSAGKNESAETGAAEEEMTRLWDRLDASQRQSLSGLGSDLNWVRRRGQPPPRGRQAADGTPHDYETLVQTHDAADWHAYLHQLRLCAPGMPAIRLAHLRGTAWTDLGFPQLARIFYDLAADLEKAPGL